MECGVISGDAKPGSLLIILVHRFSLYGSRLSLQYRLNFNRSAVISSPMGY